jgi:hypothetical protein
MAEILGLGLGLGVGEMMLLCGWEFEWVSFGKK